MSDLENINKSLDNIEGNLENLYKELEAGKTSQKAYESELKALGDKQAELAKALSDTTQSLDATVKGMKADRDAMKSLGELASENAVLKSFKSGTAVFDVKSAPVGTAAQGAANSITRGTLAPAYEAGWKTLPDQPLGIEDLFPHVSVSVDAITYQKGGGLTDGSAVTKEGEALPQSTVTKPSLATANVVDIGSYAIVTHQLITNEAAFASYINAKMQYKLRLAVENQLINGTGGATQLSGLLNTGNHTDKTTEARAGLPKSGATLFDLALLLKAEFEKQFISPQNILLNPADWTQLCLLKDSRGYYLLGGPQSLASKSLWGVPVITSSLVPSGKYIMGDFTQAATIYEREALQFRISDQDAENFKSNLYTLRVTRRLAFSVELPELVYAGNFALADA